MKKKKLYGLIAALTLFSLTACGNEANTDSSVNSEKESLVQKEEDNSVKASDEVVAESKEIDSNLMNDDQAIEAIRNYCFTENPDLKDIIEKEEYPTYWIIESSGEDEIVVMYRSYTGAQKRFYVERITGNTYTTEFVPGITDQEEQTDEHFNANDYLNV